MAEQPIIIKRKKGGHAGHHGGAWKVAYADFVTAMMAFFLLLWLLNAVTEEQLQGVADYFAPTSVSNSSSGAGGMLGGKVVGEGAMSSNASTPSFSLSLPPPTIGQGGDALSDPKEGGDEGMGPGQGGEGGQGSGPNSGGPSSGNDAGQAGKGPNAAQGATGPGALGQGAFGQGAGAGSSGGRSGAQQGAQGQAMALTEAQIKEANAKREQQQFDRAQDALKQAINSIPELRKMADSLMVDNTPEGLRIQIVDQDGLAMFPKGSPDMYGHTKALLDLVGRVVKMLPEKVAISGHTDAVPFSSQGSYGNWELSADRALATRRALLASGVPADRIDRVVGRADQEPIVRDDPANARNRRISIVLLRDSKQIPTVQVSPDAARSGSLPDALKPFNPDGGTPPPPKPR